VRVVSTYFATKSLSGHGKGKWVSVIKTGWAVEIPHEHALMIYSRSGHGFKALTTLANGTGVVDF